MADRDQQLFDLILQGDRVALGQAMTLVESRRPEDRQTAVGLLGLCEAKLQAGDPSLRITISGAPGAGKSTLIEALGLKAIASGQKVGVLTIDPSSTLSHGSILGDKSRMNRLANTPGAFIRSSAAGDVLGGLGRRTYDLMTLLAAVGYDLILIETVGVGQSEHMAWQFTDGFLLVVQPGGGDELQGIKRGITELADIVVVNKADGPMKDLARMTLSQYQNAIHYFSAVRKGWTPQVIRCSALESTGIDQLWDVIRLYKETLAENSSLLQDRMRQRRAWLQWTLGETARQLIMHHPVIQMKLNEVLARLEHQSSSWFMAEYEIENTMKSLISEPNTDSEKNERK